MRLLVVTLWASVAPSVARADLAGEAAVRAVERLGGTVEQNGRVVPLSYTPIFQYRHRPSRRWS